MADTQAEVNLKRSEFLDDIFEGIRNHGIHGNEYPKKSPTPNGVGSLIGPVRVSVGWT